MAVTWRVRAQLVVGLLVVLALFQLPLIVLGLPGLSDETPWAARLYLISCGVDLVLALVLVVSLALSIGGHGRPGRLAGAVAGLEATKVLVLVSALAVLLVLAWRDGERLFFPVLYLLAVLFLSAATLFVAMVIRVFQRRRQDQFDNPDRPRPVRDMPGPR